MRENDLPTGSEYVFQSVFQIRVQEVEPGMAGFFYGYPVAVQDCICHFSECQAHNESRSGGQQNRPVHGLRDGLYKIFVADRVGSRYVVDAVDTRIFEGPDIKAAYIIEMYPGIPRLAVGKVTADAKTHGLDEFRQGAALLCQCDTDAKLDCADAERCYFVGS